MLDEIMDFVARAILTAGGSAVSDGRNNLWCVVDDWEFSINFDEYDIRVVT